jgi:AraC-like DNA-binding protein
MLTVFDSATITARERLGAWRDITATSLIPTALDSPDPEAFTARLRAVPLGDAQGTAMAYTSLSSRRSPREIRRSDPEYYQVAHIRAGRPGITQNDASAMLRRGDLVIYDSSRPFEAVNVCGTAPAETVLLQFPKRMLPLPVQQVVGLYHLTIATIAHRWGFARPADFSRTFRRQTGMPPREYRDIT